MSDIWAVVTQHPWATTALVAAFAIFGTALVQSWEW
jgi:hypothetical protein